MKNVAIFCSASDFVDKSFFKETFDFGRMIAKENFQSIYGGTNVGLMGAFADGVLSNNGNIIGIITKGFLDEKIAKLDISQLIVTKDLFDRKKEIFKMADCFVALPGGFGTLDEIFESITLLQIGEHVKPVMFYNINNFFEDLLIFLQNAASKGFIPKEFLNKIIIANNLNEAKKYFKSFK